MLYTAKYLKQERGKTGGTSSKVMPLFHSNLLDYSTNLAEQNVVTDINESLDQNIHKKGP